VSAPPERGTAENPEDARRRQYHLAVAPGEVAPFVLLVGDPGRAELVAARFDEVELERRNREYVTITGRHRGLRLTVLGTGIGADNTEIALVELGQVVDAPTLVRCGSCGGLQREVATGDLVVSRGAYRLETTSTWFVGEGYPAVADHEVVLALLEAAERQGVRHHLGLTASSPGFYGAQDRHLPGFPLRDRGVLEDLQRQGVLNIEMEASCLFSLAGLAGWRAGAICAVYANRHEDELIRQERKAEAEASCIDTALEAFHVLARLDAERGERRWWHPGTGSAGA
jgi:uridine phosphorylase